MVLQRVEAAVPVAGERGEELLRDPHGGRAQPVADPAAFAGLAGMGDLVLTCTGGLSRNRSVGQQLGQGKKLDVILKELGQTAEGVTTARSVHDLARREGIEMPIADAVYRLLFEGADARAEVYGLMGRKLKSEHE